MTPEQELRFELDDATRRLAARSASEPVAKRPPPTVEVTESTLGPGKFISDVNNQTQPGTSVSPGGPPPPPPGDDHHFETISGASNGVPATLVVDTDGTGWIAL